MSGYDSSSALAVLRSLMAAGFPLKEASELIAPPPPLRQMDPALKRLLDNLPNGDPDAAEPELVEVWTPWTPKRHTVPCGEAIPLLVFGRWAGPEMAVREIPIRVRNVRTGREARLDTSRMLWSCSVAGPAAIKPGLELSISNTRFVA